MRIELTNETITFLKCFFIWCVDQEYLAYNPIPKGL